ncbi:MAG: hypothetical protein ACRD50_01100 [Candidatus Acidiferrales bacterium]
MNLCTGKEAAERVQGLLNAKFQVHAQSVELTIKNIFALDPVGKVDFGGGEYQAAGRVEIARTRVNPEDRYTWWSLGRGVYIAELNETLELADNEFALLLPESRLLRAGASHAEVFLRGRVEPIEVLLTVHTARADFKENARISSLRLFRME